jgi:hypothetical protein
LLYLGPDSQQVSVSPTPLTSWEVIMTGGKMRLQVENLDDRTVPSALGGGRAAVTYEPPVLTVVPTEQTVEVSAEAEAGLTIATQPPKP